MRPLLYVAPRLPEQLGLLLIVVFSPAVAGLMTLLLPRGAISVRVATGALGPAASLAAIGLYISDFGLEDGRVSVRWIPEIHLDLSFLADALGLFFASLIAGIGLIIVLYARAYFGPDAPALRRFYPLIALFMTAMLGLVLADDFVLMLVFWELTSISSFLLIGWDTRHAQSVRNALHALVVTGAGGLAMLGGLVLVGLLTGRWAFSALGALPESGLMLAAFALIYAGIAAKSAQWPLHPWLPAAMVAPTPVSAYLHSAAMVKAGIYLLARLWPHMSELWLWPPLVIGIGALTMVWGAFIAIQRDVLKEILAYTTISQLGLLAAAFGLAAYSYEGERNIVWGNAQVLNHAVYKGALFMLAGGMTIALGRSSLSELRGALRVRGMRIYGLLFLLGLIALAAIPGTFSFFAKEAFLYQAWHALEVTHHPALWALIIAAVLTSIFNMAILVRFALTFLARPSAPDAPPSPDEAQSDHPAWTLMLWLPAAMLIALQFAGGLAGAVAARLLRPLEATPFYWSASDLSLGHALAHPGVPLLLTGIGITGGLLLGFSPVLARPREDWHERLYPALSTALVRAGAWLFGAIQNGWLAWYLAATLLSFAGLLSWSGYIDWRHFGTLWPGEIDALPGLGEATAGWLLCGLVCTSAILMTVMRDRITRVLVLGTVGFGVTGVYYVYAAPDLALTQLSIEIVSLVLFLLVLDLLPRAAVRTRQILPLRLALAILVGGITCVVTLIATSGTPPPRPPLLADGSAPRNLGQFFLRNSYEGIDTASVDAALLGTGVVDRGADHLFSFGSKPHFQVSEGENITLHKGGGGANVVNVILVDFRGFDTLGEITVLAIAAMGVWTLLRKPPTRRDRAPTDNRSIPFEDTFAVSDPDDPPARVHPGQLPRGRSPVHSETIATTILRNAVRVLIPLAVVFAIYLFLKGHQSPGGGFIAGLAAAVGLLVYRMCFGCEALYRLMPVRERTLLALGLALAALTTAAPLAWGLPPLTSNSGHFPLPGGYSYHWASVMIFDAGVFLVVIGAVVGMIDAIARELE